MNGYACLQLAPMVGFAINHWKGIVTTGAVLSVLAIGGSYIAYSSPAGIKARFDYCMGGYTNQLERCQTLQDNDLPVALECLELPIREERCDGLKRKIMEQAHHMYSGP